MSSETSIFKCSLCLAIFNNTIRTPQSLPCGHVFCKACITDYSKTHLTCPLDQTSHPAVDKLPSCINILNNLPKPQYKISFCSIHTKRHIKYRCKIHNVFICSECVIQHAGSGHDLQAFKISPEKIREEIKKLSESTLTLFYDSETALKEYDILDRRILRFYDNQISKVTASFDAAIKSLQIKKSELIDELSKVLREQLANLEEKKLSVIASLERSKEWSLKIQSLSNEIMEITYDEYYKHISEISKQLNLVPKTNPVNFGIKFMVFNDMINLKEMGSISQIKEPLWNCNKCKFSNSYMSRTCQVCFSAKNDKSLNWEPANLFTMSKLKSQNVELSCSSPADFSKSSGLLRSPNQKETKPNSFIKSREKSRDLNPFNSKSNVSF